MADEKNVATETQTQTGDFNALVIKAVDEKIAWFNSSLLPKVQEAYRNHLIFVRNLFDILQRRSLITPDPYKHDKKISDISGIEDTDFNENERSQKLGLRLSDYESMVDYICTYLKFVVDQLSASKIKKLLAFNASFAWGNLSSGSGNMNSRALGAALSELKNTGGQSGMTIGMLFESITKTAHDMDEVNRSLKLLGNFQRERYKSDVRRNVVASSKFNKTALYDHDAMLAEIKRLFPTCMPKRALSEELITEIVNEDTSAGKEALRKKLLQSLKIVEEKKEKKEQGPDLHELVMLPVRTLATLTEQYNLVYGKLVNNHDILEMENNTFKQKVFRFMRRMFGLDDPPVEYEVTITERGTDQKKRELITYNTFMENLAKRIKFYGTLSARNSPNYAKMNAQKNDFIFAFISKQISENGTLQNLLEGLDEFFKASVSGLNRSKIKGIKMELTTLKNILVKANQQRSEYAAYVEEEEQLRKLGIK